MQRLLLIFGLANLLMLAGCTSPPAGETPPQDAQGRFIIAMTSGLTFEPPEAKVPLGATVVWINNASVAHDVAGYRGDPIKEDREAFSSFRQPPEGLGRPIEPGENFTQVFSEKGAWTIWCHTHHEERMKQVIHVG